MLPIIRRKLESLRCRILSGIFIILFLAIGAVIFSIYTYQHDKLIDLSARKAAQLSEVIAAGLRSSMLQNDRTQAKRSIDSILQAAGRGRISIINPEGKITLTSDPGVAGQALDMAGHPSCRPCHKRPGTPERMIVTEITGEQMISTVTPIRNEPACSGCHGEGKGLIGILLFESPFEETAVMLNELARRIILTGLLAFILGALLLNSLVSRFFARPLQALLKGCEQVRRGNYEYRVNVGCGGEIGYMADSFNTMSGAIAGYVKQIKEKNREVAAHYTIVNTLSRTIDKKILKETVIDLLCNLLDAECVILVLRMENNRDVYEMLRMRGCDSRHYHCYYHMDCENEVGDMCGLAGEELKEWRAGEIRETACREEGRRLLISLEHEKLSIGIISLRKKEGRTFSAAEKKLIPVLSHHIAISLANARLYDMAISDSLTALYTKRYFDSKLREYIQNYHHARQGFCLLLLDLDHFKSINDRYGHPVGDRMLSLIAEVTRTRIRHGDLAFRYGGEEFAILLRGDELEDGVRVAERIRSAVSKAALEIEGKQPITATISVGVACFPHHFTEAAELVNAADSALYKAKQKGRNKVVVYCREGDSAGCY